MKRVVLGLLMGLFIMVSAGAQGHMRGHDWMGGRNRIHVASPQQIDMIVDYLKGLSFDSERLKAAKLCVSICPIAANDLAYILDFFTFDDKKVEVLKAAYAYCPDKEHFHRAVERLSFLSSQEEVYRYIESWGE